MIGKGRIVEVIHSLEKAFNHVVSCEDMEIFKRYGEFEENYGL